MRKILPFLVAFLLFASQGWSATYYMRAGGTAANLAAAVGPCGTQANTMSIATYEAATPTAGDTIKVCDDGGDFKAILNPPVSGTSGNIITHEAESGDTPVFTGADVVATWETGARAANVYEATLAVEPELVFMDDVLGDEKALENELVNEYDWWFDDPNNQLVIYAPGDPDTEYTEVEATVRDQAIYLDTGQDYLTFKGLTLKHTDNNAFTSNGASIYITLDDLTITYVAGNAIAGDTNSTNWEIKNCTISYAGIGFGDSGDITLGRDAIYLFGGMDDISIHDNDISFSGGDDITIGAEVPIGDIENVSIYKNTLRDGASLCIGIAMESGVTTGPIYIYENDIYNHDSAEIKVNSANTYVYRNKIHGGVNNASNLIIINDANGDGAKIYNNIFYDHDGNTYNGITLWGGGDDVEILGNTFYEMHDALELCGSGSTNRTGLIIKNNIIFNGTGDGMEACAGFVATIENNNVDSNSNDYDADVGEQAGSNGNISVDPLFTNAPGGDFTLASNSPMISAGQDLGDSYDDGIDPGSTWPTGVTTTEQDPDWEIGAYIFNEAPIVSDGLPAGVQACASDPLALTLQVTTNETAECRFIEEDNDDCSTAWAGMAAFTTTDATTHQESISKACNASYEYCVKCQDPETNESPYTDIDFSVGGTPPPDVPTSVTGVTLSGGASMD